MKRVIPFSKARYYFFAFSLLLVLVGVVGYVINHGLNLGVDFKAGIALQFQVAPASFSVTYVGPDKAEISIPAGEQAITSAGDIIVTITRVKDGTKQTFPFRYADYTTVRDLTSAISRVDGLRVEQKGDMEISPTSLLPLPRPANISDKAFTINLTPGPGRGVRTSIGDIRATLAPMGQFDLQEVGATGTQEFIARMEAKTEDQSFQTNTEARVMQILGEKFGANQVILKRTDFVGPRLSQSLASQSIWLVLIAVALILVYMIFRFHPAIYGFAAVIGIMHDALVMLSFDAVFRVEVDAATIAAILTILGYSINDTIVIFDRVRENNGLMRGTPLRSILDTSVNQTLSRTFITSGATLLTVIALFIFTSGSMKNFALNMIVGIVEGTYSTFISSFIVLEWNNMRDRQRKRRDQDKYGIHRAEKPAELKRVEAAVEEEAGEEAEGEAVPEPMAAEPIAAEPITAEPMAADPLAAMVPGADPAAVVQPQPLPQPRPAAQGAGVVAFPGHSGSRKHKKHKRRHH